MDGILEMVLIQLHDEESDARAEALRLLAQMPSPLDNAVMENLVRRFYMERTPLCAQILQVLDKHGGITWNVLYYALHGNNPYAKAHALDYLNRFPEADEAHILVEAMYEQDSRIQQKAARRLHQRYPEFAATHFLDFLRTDERSFSPMYYTLYPLLIEMGATVLDGLLEWLRTTYGDHKVMALQLLGDLRYPEGKPRIFAALLDQLHDPYGEVIRRAILTLGRLDAAAALPYLVPFLADSDSDIRVNAVWAIGQVAEAKIVPLLVERFKDSAWEVRHEALQRVEHLGDVAVDALEAIALDEKPVSKEYRRLGIEALVLIGTPRAHQILWRALEHPLPHMRRSALRYAVKSQLPQAISPLARLLYGVSRLSKEELWQALERITDGLYMRRLNELYDDGDFFTRWYLLQVFKDKNDPHALEMLLRACEDVEPALREVGAKMLGELKYSGAIDLLGNLLADEHRGVRHEAENALKSIGTREAWNTLLKASLARK